VRARCPELHESCVYKLEVGQEQKNLLFLPELELVRDMGHVTLSPCPGASPNVSEQNLKVLSGHRDTWVVSTCVRPWVGTGSILPTV
jgi:hypothetical protein